MYDPAAPWPGIGRRSAGYDFGFDPDAAGPEKKLKGYYYGVVEG